MRITRHGFPAARLYGGMSLVTTLPAPITHPSPMVTPPQTTTLDASQQLSFIVIEGKAKERNFGRQTPGDQRFIKKTYHF